MSAISERKLLPLIGSFYEAAQRGAADGWFNVYLELAKLLGADSGGFTIYDTERNQFHTAISTLDPHYLKLYLENFQHQSVIRKDIAKLKAGERYNRAEQMPDEEFRSHPLYRGFYAPAGIFHMEYQVFLVRPGMHGGVSFMRRDGRPNFGRAELGALALLLPHLERAFQIYIKTIDIGLENKVLSEAVDHLPRGVMVVDSGLSIAFANTEARALLAAKDGMRSDATGRLVISSPGEEKTLRAVLERVLASRRARSEALLVSRPSGLRAFEVLVTSFASGQRRSITSEPLALLFISDPAECGETVQSLLRGMYRLTQAEARLASMLAEGKNLGEACVSLGIQTSTGRTHLKRVFSKTDTSRQGELIKLIINGPANIHLRARK